VVGELPARSLHEELPLDELHWMNDGANLMPALLFRSPARVLRFDQASCRVIGPLDIARSRVGQQ
jgi:hypothetical protein